MIETAQFLQKTGMILNSVRLFSAYQSQRKLLTEVCLHQSKKLKLECTQQEGLTLTYAFGGLKEALTLDCDNS